MAVPAMPQVRSSLPTGGMPVPRACRKFDRIVNFVRTKKTWSAFPPGLAGNWRNLPLRCAPAC